MPAQSLNHYTIRVRDLEATKDFYTSVVGLTVGDRPPLNFPGYWLYCGGVPTVHLIGYRAEDPVIKDGPADPAATGRLDHIAFACEGLKDMKANLESHGIKYDERVLPRLEHEPIVLFRSGWHRGGMQLLGARDRGARGYGILIGWHFERRVQRCAHAHNAACHRTG